jgi:hypothetical protein
LETFFNLLSFGTPYRSHHTGLADIVLQAEEAVSDLLDHPYTWAGFGLFVVTARKKPDG